MVCVWGGGAKRGREECEGGSATKEHEQGTEMRVELPRHVS